jgi:hypothetical protein
MADIVSYRLALISLKNKIDVYKKNKLSTTIFSLFFLLFLLAVATIFLLKFGLSKHFFNLGPAGVAIASFAVMVSFLAIGYWLIFKNPSTTVKRQALYESLVLCLTDVAPHSALHRAVVQDYKNQLISEHALLNMVLEELRRTETL